MCSCCSLFIARMVSWRNVAFQLEQLEFQLNNDDCWLGLISVLPIALAQSYCSSLREATHTLHNTTQHDTTLQIQTNKQLTHYCC